MLTNILRIKYSFNNQKLLLPCPCFYFDSVIFYAWNGFEAATNWTLRSKERATVVRPTVSNTWIFESFEHVQDWLKGTIYCGDVDYTVTNNIHEAFNTLAQAQFWYSVKFSYTCGPISKVTSNGHYSSKRWSANEIANL